MDYRGIHERCSISGYLFSLANDEIWYRVLRYRNSLSTMVDDRVSHTKYITSADNLILINQAPHSERQKISEGQPVCSVSRK